MDSGRKSVWLLKTERRGVSGEPDPYKAAFSAANWDCTFVPVLSFNFINQDKLGEAIGGINAYSGLILTSQRAAVALEQALSKRPVSLSANFPVFAVVRSFYLNSFGILLCLNTDADILACRARRQVQLPAKPLWAHPVKSLLVEIMLPN
jgi:hypothetical protein